MSSDAIGAAAVGAGAGAFATVVMSVPMIAARKLRLMPELPPQDIVDDIVHRSSVDGPSRTGRRALGWASHLAFGMAAGASYGALRRLIRPAASDATTGVAFALFVWTVSYMGWVPALGVLPPATEDRPGRPATMIIAHVVFGLVLGSLVGRWGGRVRGPSVTSPRTWVEDGRDAS
jgi:hypothetical protein